LAIDGLEYFSSKTIHSEHCSTRQHANGTITYYHSMMVAALVKPNSDKIIPWFPEFIQPQDGEKNKIAS